MSINQLETTTFLGRDDFFVCFFFQENFLKYSNNYRCAVIHNNALMNAIRNRCSL